MHIWFVYSFFFSLFQFWTCLYLHMKLSFLVTKKIKHVCTIRFWVTLLLTLSCKHFTSAHNFWFAQACRFFCFRQSFLVSQRWRIVSCYFYFVLSVRPDNNFKDAFGLWLVVFLDVWYSSETDNSSKYMTYTFILIENELIINGYLFYWFIII